MHFRLITAVGVMALTLSAGACSREAAVDRRDPGATPAVDRTAALQEQRNQDLSKMDDRVAALEREYQEKRATTPSGTSGKKATPSLHDEVTSDIDDVKEAVSNLRTTTAGNWWERHQSALETAVGDVEKDVKRFAGTSALPTRAKATRATTDASGQPVSTAPFTSSRDKFVADMRTHLEAMGKALDGVKATGPRKTERDDLHARIDKLAADISRLGSAGAEDWWDLSKARVNDYIDRLERSVARLDDNKR